MSLDIRTGEVEKPKSIRFAGDQEDEVVLTHITRHNEDLITLHSEDGEVDVPLTEDDAKYIIKALEWALQEGWWG